MENLTDTFLENSDFQKEKYKYNLLYKMLLSKDKLFYSNQEYVLGRSSNKTPTWVWTKDNLSYEKVLEVEELLRKYYLSEETSLTCKKELYEYLKRDFNVRDYFEMGFLVCHKLKDVKLSDGYMDRPNYSDKTLLAKYWQNSCKEQDNLDLTYEECLEEVSNWLNSDTFYVWRNKLGKVVSMANYSVVSNMAKVSHVYTPDEERCKGYCTSLVYELTKKLLEKGLVPLLYTNYNYKPSNHTYKKVGYESEGYLVNFKVRK